MAEERSAIIFHFPSPTNHTRMAQLVAMAKKIFEDEKDVRIHATRGEAAEIIISFLMTQEAPEESNLVKHARHELGLLDNDAEFNDCIIKAIREFASYGHGGESADYGIQVLNDLLRNNNLAPLTDDPKEWNNVGPSLWQSSRNSEAFSEDGGKTYRITSEDEGIHYTVRMYREPAEDDTELGGEG